MYFSAGLQLLLGLGGICSNIIAQRTGAIVISILLVVSGILSIFWVEFLKRQIEKMKSDEKFRKNVNRLLLIYWAIPPVFFVAAIIISTLVESGISIEDFRINPEVVSVVVVFILIVVGIAAFVLAANHPHKKAPAAADEIQEPAISTSPAPSSAQTAYDPDTMKKKGNRWLTLAGGFAAAVIILGIWLLAPWLQRVLFLNVDMKPAPYNIAECYYWDEIDENFRDREICVIGILSEVRYNTEEKRTSLYFSEGYRAFVLIDRERHVPDLTGTCVTARGVVLMPLNTPYMLVNEDNLFRCP